MMEDCYVLRINNSVPGNMLGPFTHEQATDKLFDLAEANGDPVDVDDWDGLSWVDKHDETSGFYIVACS